MARASRGPSRGRTSPAGRFTTSRVRQPTRIGFMLRNRAVGSDSRSNAPRTAARPGTPVGNQFAYDGDAGTHQWYDGTRTPGSSSASGISSRRSPTPTPSTPGVEDAALFRTTDGGQTWTELAGLRRPRHGAALAAGRRRHVPAHDSPRSDQSRPHLHRHLGRRRVPDRRRRQDLAADQPRTALPIHPRPDGRGRPLRAPHRHASARARTCCSCRSIGTSCAATTPATPGTR